MRFLVESRRILQRDRLDPGVLGGTEEAESFGKHLVVARQHCDREQCRVAGTGLADGKRCDGNARWHLHD